MPAKIVVEPEVQARMVSMYLGHHSISEIAAAEGLKPMKVRSLLLENDVVIRSRSEACAIRAAKTPCSNESRGRKGAFHSEKMNCWLATASCYEYARMLQLECDHQVAGFARSTDRIKYIMDGRIRHYTPDLEVTKVTGEVVVEEIKPLIFSGKREVQAKAAAASAFYATRGKRYAVITEEQIGANMIALAANYRASLSQAEAGELRAMRRRESSKQYMRRKRAAHTPTEQERMEHSAKQMARYYQWKSTATPEQIEARRAQGREAMRRRRLKKSAYSNTINHSFGSNT